MYLPIVMFFETSTDGWEHSTGEAVSSYYIIGEEYYLGYWKTRYHLKAMTYIAYAFGIFTAGCQMEKEDTDQIIAGKAFPEPFLQELSHVAWHPTDYIFADGESGAVEDSDGYVAHS